jgi:GNAT superfamily N-acetyltransferase
VTTARREGEVVGVGAAWLEDNGGHVAVFVDPPRRRQGVGSAVLAQLESAARRTGWDVPSLAASGSAAFFAARSGYSKTTEE